MKRKENFPSSARLCSVVINGSTCLLICFTSEVFHWNEIVFQALFPDEQAKVVCSSYVLKWDKVFHFCHFHRIKITKKKTFGTINSTQKLMFSMTVIFSRGSNHCARWDYCNVFTFLFLCRNFQKKDFLHDRSLEKIKNVPFLAQHHSAIFSFCLIPFLILRMSKLCIV